MKIQTVRSMWGNDRGLEEAARDAVSKGYTFIECGFIEQPNVEEYARVAEETGIRWISQIHSGAWEGGLSPEAHLDDFRRRLAWAKSIDPVLINVHAGGDHFTVGEAIRFFKEFVKIGAGEADVPVVAETHRGRALYSPWVARDVLPSVPGLRLCADYSHFTCVTEGLLDHAKDVLELCAERVEYVHARVGTTQASQVNDPRAPENAHLLEAFEGYWDTIVQARKTAEKGDLPVCPEFGPQPYLPAHPFTGQDITDLDAVIDWMAERVVARYNQ